MDKRKLQNQLLNRNHHFFKSIFSVQIEAFIWDRDSHGLYDYESKNIVRQSMKCTGCSKYFSYDHNFRYDCKKRLRIKGCFAKS
jgi:hypothetical protein